MALTGTAGMRAGSIYRGLDRKPEAGALHSFGFAGAMPVDVGLFARLGVPGDLAFFGCDLEISRRYGHSNPGAAGFVRAETASRGMPRTGAYDLGTVSAGDPAQAMIEIADTAAMVASRGGLPALVGCDHTASLAGLVGSTRAASERAVYVYFDAHFDLGRNCEPSDQLHNGGFVGEMLRRRWVRCAINIGGRSMATRLSYPPTPRFANIPADASTRAILQCLAILKGQEVYVSIDADVLDPLLAPNVSCPEPDGLSAETLLSCCRWLGRNCRVMGADLTEIRPDESRNGAEPQLLECLYALAGKDKGIESAYSAEDMDIFRALAAAVGDGPRHRPT